MTIMRRVSFAAAALMAGLAAQPAGAATPESWNEFQQRVAAACLAAAEGLFETAEARVDPFGSESFGLALISGTARGADVRIEAICVYDKVNRTAEIGGELPMEVATPDVAALAWAEGWDCAADCQRVVEGLVEEDVAALIALPDRVARTIGETEGDPMLANEEGALAALARLRAAEGGALDDVATGERTCTVYWYGFLENASQRVGAHRCRIVRDGDALTLAKLTGELQFGWIEPIGGGVGAFIGRSFLADHRIREYNAAIPANAENENFGNRVALVIPDGEDLLIVSADMRGFTEPDEMFFEVMVVE